MRRKLPVNITESCSVCEYAKRVALTGELLCARKKNLKRVSDDYLCRKFSFDILSYRPNPSKPPKFNAETVEDL